MTSSAIDEHLGELLGLQGELLALTRRWAAGEAVDAVAAPLRHRAIECNHRRYCQRIPLYRDFAADLGLNGPQPVAVIANELLLGDEVFKSYDANLLKQKDFLGMTAWLSTIYHQPIPLGAETAAALATVDDWRAALRRLGVFLSHSSGTSGAISCVPRDAMTWRALQTNPKVYADTAWFGQQGQAVREYDCLVAGPAGAALGIQGAAAGLSRTARATFFVESARFDAAHLSGDAPFTPNTADYDGAAAFMRAARAAARPLVVFGTPYQLHALAQHLQNRAVGDATNADVIVCGGGWKRFDGERLARSTLTALLDAALGIPAPRFMDSYGSAELNCTLVSCAWGRYHVPPLLELVRVDADLRVDWPDEAAATTPAGQQRRCGEGLLGFLDPFAASYPGFVLTRDMGTLGYGRCDCGRTGFWIDGDIRRAPKAALKGCAGVLAAVSA